MTSPHKSDVHPSGSAFFVPYYREFRRDFAGIRLRKNRTSGAGGARNDSVYILKAVTLTVSDEAVALHQAPVFPLGASSDRTYGNLGRDLIADYQSFTLDFAGMRFVLGKRV